MYTESFVQTHPLQEAPQSCLPLRFIWNENKTQVLQTILTGTHPPGYWASSHFLRKGNLVSKCSRKLHVWYNIAICCFVRCLPSDSGWYFHSKVCITIRATWPKLLWHIRGRDLEMAHTYNKMLSINKRTEQKAFWRKWDSSIHM